MAFALLQSATLPLHNAVVEPLGNRHKAANSFATAVFFLEAICPLRALAAVEHDAMTICHSSSKLTRTDRTARAPLRKMQL